MQEPDEIRGFADRPSVSCLFVDFNDPLMLRSIVEFPNPLRPRHHVQVIKIIPVRSAAGMITTRHHNRVPVIHGHGFVNFTVIGINPLKSKSLTRIEPMIVDFLKGRLSGKIVGIMLVGG